MFLLISDLPVRSCRDELCDGMRQGVERIDVEHRERVLAVIHAALVQDDRDEMDA